jgi:radical SAM superfamily enzyme YgiQ (UPF0313 family)
MKIVWASPPNLVYDQTPHYFQALFSAGAVYLRSRFPEAEVVTEAAGFHGAVERVILRHFACHQPADFLILWARPWEAHAARRVAKEVAELSPHTKILVWGEACSYIPHYFEREPFDFYAVSGDPERVIADAVEAYRKGELPWHGGSYVLNGAWHNTQIGETLEPSEWGFPDLEAIDSTVYTYWRKQRGQKRDDLSFYVSRGCPINCARWCPTPRKEGTKDRRRSVEDTVNYMRVLPEPYSMFQMHSPLFSMDREWVDEFIKLKRRVCPDTPFKVVDLMNPYADEELVAGLASVGLKNVGFGVETLSAKGRHMIPKMEPSLLEKVAANLVKYGVTSKAYVQLGLPNQTKEDIIYTLKVLVDLGLKPRPTGSTPFWKLAKMSVEELDATDLTRWDRKTYYDPRTGLTYREFLGIVHDPVGFLMGDEELLKWAA